MGIYGPQIRKILAERFSYDELLTLALDFGISLDDLPGEGKSAKARELFVYLSRHDKLRALEEYIVKNRPEFRPEIGWSPLPESISAVQRDDLASLSIELSRLRQELREVQERSVDNEQFEQRMQDVLKLADRAVGRSEGLSARIVLPPPEMTDVHLVPTHSLDRLEEYRSDENIVYLLIGTFGGATLGIISNWVTNDPFVITPLSGILLALLVILTVACILWARRIQHRAQAVKEQILSESISTSS